MNDVVKPPVTYGRLSEALIRLGFVRRDTAEYIAFKNPAYDALIAFPIIQPQEPVRPAHLLAAQATVTASGVASESTFKRILYKGAMEDAHILSETATAQSEAA